MPGTHAFILFGSPRGLLRITYRNDISEARPWLLTRGSDLLGQFSDLVQARATAASFGGEEHQYCRIVFDTNPRRYPTDSGHAFVTITWHPAGWFASLHSAAVPFRTADAPAATPAEAVAAWCAVNQAKPAGEPARRNLHEGN